MKTYNFFIVEVEKKAKDTLKMSSGVELYIDPKFNEFEHRTQSGKVIAAPFKYEHGVKKGDELYFHHLVVMNDGQPLTGYDNHYLVAFDPKQCINSQAIAYKSAETGEIHPLSTWVLVEQIQEDRDEKSDVIELVELKKKAITKGRIVYENQVTEDLGVKKGDVVAFKENMDYDIEVDGKAYGRVRSVDLMYVEETV